MHVWVSVLVVLEEDESFSVDVMRNSKAFPRRALFSDSLAILIGCDSLIKGNDLVHTYQF